MDNLHKFFDTAGSAALAAWLLFWGAVAFLTAIIAMIAAETWRSRGMVGIFAAGMLLGWLV